MNENEQMMTMIKTIHLIADAMREAREELGAETYNRLITKYAIAYREIMGDFDGDKNDQNSRN